MELTFEQLVVKSLKEGQHLVLAPPGTGKTKLLADRVIHGLSNGLNPAKMLCLTFTNRAAKEMKRRVEEVAPNNKCFIGNIHRFGVRFLFRNNLISQATTLLDEEDSNLLLQEAKSISNFHNDKIKDHDLLQANCFIKQLANNFPYQVILRPETNYYQYEDVAQVCGEYEKLKEEYNYFDFDDILFYTYRSLNRNHKPYLLTEYEWVQVDEAQDLNPLQWGIIKLLCSENAHKVYFGDFDQAIYSFMGARIASLREFANKYTLHYLNKNFRSPSYLLDIYIEYSRAHFPMIPTNIPKSNLILSTPAGALQLIKVILRGEWRYRFKDEIGYIARAVLPPLIDEPQNRTAFLVRWNKQADEISKELSDHQIDYFKISGYDLFRRKLIKDIMAFLACIENSREKNSWIRIFYIFGKVPTLRESRKIINYFFKSGVLPEDVLFINSGELIIESFIKDFANRRIVVFDTETTGLDKNNDDIIQIAAIEIIKGVIGREFVVYLKTERSLALSQSIHNISKEELELKGKDREEGLTEFLKFINNDILIAHNANYDLSILKSNLLSSGVDYSPILFDRTYDTIDLCRRAFPLLNSYKLRDLIEVLGIEGINSHNAIDDVRATVRLIEKIIPVMEEKLIVATELLLEHTAIINNLRNNFAPIYLEMQRKRNTLLNFTTLINDFLTYAFDRVDYEPDPIERYHLLKLTRHMDYYCETKELKNLLKNHLPDYKLYKESDLIIGNEKIIISTIHKAKGLEFETVIIPFCSPGNFPSFMDKTEEDRLESARTLYVALTRAKKKLIITFTNRESEFLHDIKKYFEISEV